MIDFDIEDMRQFADRHRGKHIMSGPHWSTIIRFPILFDEYERLLAENRELNQRIENLKMSPEHQARVQAVKHMLEMTSFLRHIMTLGLLRGSPRLTTRALEILDGFEASGIEDSVTQNTTEENENGARK